MTLIGILTTTLTFINILVCLLLIFVVLLQRPKSEGLGTAFGGDTASSVLGPSASNTLATITRWLGGIFLGLCFIIAILGTVDPEKKSANTKFLNERAAAATAAEAKKQADQLAQEAENNLKGLEKNGLPPGKTFVVPPAGDKPAVPPAGAPALEPGAPGIKPPGGEPVKPVTPATPPAGSPATPPAVTPPVGTPATPPVVTPPVGTPATPPVVTPPVGTPATPPVVTPVVTPVTPPVVTPPVVTPTTPPVVTPATPPVAPAPETPKPAEPAKPADAPKN